MTSWVVLRHLGLGVRHLMGAGSFEVVGRVSSIRANVFLLTNVAYAVIRVHV